MKISDTTKKISGTLHLRAYDHVGRPLWETKGQNLVVASGYAAAAEALTGTPGAKITAVAIGTNGEIPTSADTQLKNAVSVPIRSVEYPEPGTVRFNFTVGYDVAPGMNIREFGLITEDGRLFSRKTREILEKSQYLTLAGYWEIKM